MPKRSVVKIVKRIEVLQTECVTVAAWLGVDDAIVAVACMFKSPYARCMATSSMSIALMPMNGIITPPTP